MPMPGWVGGGADREVRGPGPVGGRRLGPCWSGCGRGAGYREQVGAELVGEAEGELEHPLFRLGDDQPAGQVLRQREHLAAGGRPGRDEGAGHEGVVACGRLALQASDGGRGVGVDLVVRQQEYRRASRVHHRGTGPAEAGQPGGAAGLDQHRIVPDREQADRRVDHPSPLAGQVVTGIAVDQRAGDRVAHVDFSGTTGVLPGEGHAVRAAARRSLPTWYGLAGFGPLLTRKVPAPASTDRPTGSMAAGYGARNFDAAVSAADQSTRPLPGSTAVTCPAVNSKFSPVARRFVVSTPPVIQALPRPVPGLTARAVGRTPPTCTDTAAEPSDSRSPTRS